MTVEHSAEKDAPDACLLSDHIARRCQHAVRRPGAPMPDADYDAHDLDPELVIQLASEMEGHVDEDTVNAITDALDRAGLRLDRLRTPTSAGAEKDAPDLMTRLRDEVIAVVAEGLWDGDSDRGEPDYGRIAALYDEAASNVIPPADKDTPVEREHRDGCMTEYSWDEDDCNCRPVCSVCGGPVRPDGHWRWAPQAAHSAGAIVPERKRCICQDICLDHCRACNHSGRDLEEPCIADPDWEPDEDDLERRMAILRQAGGTDHA